MTPQLSSDLLEVVEALHAAIVRHPRAAQALYAALLAEGRRFAETEEGRLWRARLAGSALATAGRSLLDVVTLDALDETADGGIPTRVLDALALAARTQGLEPLLARAFGREPP
jgi:hypothetical protein